MEASWKEFIESLREQDSEETKTEYAYELDERAKAVAQKGLGDLPSLLSFVLALNPKFEAISLQTPELKLSFRSNPAKIADSRTGVTIVNIEEFIENQPSVQHNLVMSSDGITTVALRLRCVCDSFDLERLEPDMPRLFLDFPLFGTEDFSFPAIINSSSFRPERDETGYSWDPNQQRQC